MTLRTMGGGRRYMAPAANSRDTQFSGSICPDHMPKHPDDPGGSQAYAFGYGYITALIRAVNDDA
jgi:mannonate dehydratase